MTTSYTLNLTNEQRMTLRRLLREQVQTLQGVVTLQVRAKQFDSAERIAEEAHILEEVLASIRALTLPSIA